MNYLLVAIPTAIVLAALGIAGWWIRNRRP